MDTRVINQTKSNQVLPNSFEFGLAMVGTDERLVFLTTVKFALEKVETETVGVSLKIPRKSIITKSRVVLSQQSSH